MNQWGDSLLSITPSPHGLYCISMPTELLSSCAKCWFLAENYIREKESDESEPKVPDVGGL